MSVVTEAAKASIAATAKAQGKSWTRVLGRTSLAAPLPLIRYEIRSERGLAHPTQDAKVPKADIWVLIVLAETSAASNCDT